MGIAIARCSIRTARETLVDPGDISELGKTKTILKEGSFRLGGAMLRAAFFNPRLWLRALIVALRMGSQSERGILRHVIYLAEACVLKEWLQQWNVVHLHAHFGTNSTAIALICHVLGGPGYSFTVHGAADFDRLPFINIGLKIDYARFVVTISSYGRSQLYRYCQPSQWEKIKLIHCGVDETFLNQTLTAIPKERRVVCIGRLNPEKGQLLLIEAAYLLKKDLGESFEIIFVGDGPSRSLIEEKIQNYQLQNIVTLTGWGSGEQVREHIQNSRALVVPSFMEGLPVVIMEAFALGRPVLSTQVAGIPELVQAGHNGWLIPPGCIDSMSRTLAKILLAPPDELMQMGQMGYKIVHEHYSTTKEAKKLAKLIEEYAS
jgi:glycosyltransferase involved in cell wall biosynthesis